MKWQTKLENHQMGSGCWLQGWRNQPAQAFGSTVGQQQGVLCSAGASPALPSVHAASNGAALALGLASNGIQLSSMFRPQIKWRRTPAGAQSLHCPFPALP